MTAIRAILLVAVALLAAGCYGSRGGVQTGGNVELLREAGIEDPSLVRAAERIDRGEGGRPFKRLVERFQREPQAAQQDVALWLASGALVNDGERIRAFYYLDQLMDEHPGSPLYFAAAQRQYDIADSYLEGRSDRAFFLPVRNYDEAVEMLFRVQQRVPGSPLAERALRRTADFYFARGDYDFAEDAYGVFVDRFPRSPDVPGARLRQAYSNILQYESPRHDPTPLLDAGTQLRQFAAEYPDVATEQVRIALQWIEEQLAQKLMYQADYYRRTGEPEAQRLLMAQVVEQYPNTREAQRARRRLERSPAAPPATAPAAGGDAS